MPTAVVTGAAGFLGSHAAAELARRGWTVRGLDLRPDDERAITAADVRRPGPWCDALDGADLVLHTAAIVAESGDRARFYDVNVGGTRTVVEAAAERGVSRVLHVSSVVVYGTDFPNGVSEDAALVPTGSPYTDTKISSEHQALRVAADTGLDVVVVRLGDVYGPGSQPWTVRPLRLMRRNLFALVDGGSGILTPTYVDDAVRGALAAADHDGRHRVFNITGGTGVTTREFFGHYADALGVTLRSAPRPAVAALSHLIAGVARLRGRPAPVSPEALEYVTHPGTYSIERARLHLGWEPQFGLQEGMAHTLRWARQERLV
ncbi:MAG: NAD-dependent epimerase/dehydratase family protein [Actinobacteria bacterium]|nr:NAD-dependent epimerase/dehydratase family protein [Actinomycetota bacterium]